MTLTLRIDNYDSLENGGPTWITLNQQGASVGRRSSMDWVLPDPAKHISGHHFDVAFRDGTYWLTDVSTNGTFVQGQRHRLEGPQRLDGGERLLVGHYVIAVDISLAEAVATPQPTASVHGWTASPVAHDDGDPWDLGDAPLNPVNPLPSAGNDPHHLDDVAQNFVPLQRPTIPPGQVSVPMQQPPSQAYGQKVQQPPEAAPAASVQLSQPPFVPPPTHQHDVVPLHASPMPTPTPQRVPVNNPAPVV